MRTPDLWGFEISNEIRSETPAEAPPVKKMLSGEEGWPSRSVIIRQICEE